MLSPYKLSDVSNLQSDLSAVEQWSKSNNMALHEKKFEYLSHHTKSKLLDELPFKDEYYTYTTSSGIEIRPKKLVRDLGIYISPNLSWTPHINSITESGKKMASPASMKKSRICHDSIPE